MTTKIERTAGTRRATAQSRIPLMELLAELTEAQREELRARLWGDVAIDSHPGAPGMEADGSWGPCWVPLYSAIRGGGHRRISVRGLLIFAHRLAYVFHHGREPRGDVVRHLCGNLACVNPKHLAEGTHAESMADKRKHAARRAAQRNAALAGRAEDQFDGAKDEASFRDAERKSLGGG